jgi:hypothetical protein
MNKKKYIDISLPNNTHMLITPWDAFDLLKKNRNW